MKKMNQKKTFDPDCETYGPKIRIAAENSESPWAIKGAQLSPEAIALFFILIIKALNEWQ